MARNEKIVVFDRSEQKRLISEFHSSLVGGMHLGVKKSIKKLCSIYYWKGMKREIKDSISKCLDCQTCKHSRKTKMPMVIQTLPTRSLEYLAIDIVGPMTTSEDSFCYVLSMQCLFSRFIILAPMKNQMAETVAKTFAENYLLKFSPPRFLLSDQGRPFINDLMAKLCKLLRIKHLRTTSYHPQTNGNVERFHSQLKVQLRIFINQNHDDWPNFLPHIAFNHNTTIHESIHFS